MSEQLKEAVSALMDGAADPLEQRRLLIDANADLVRSTWVRYHRHSNLLREDARALAFQHLDISARVSAAIADSVYSADSEPVSRASRATWWRPLASFAVAAAVAVTVVIGVRAINPQEAMQLPVAAAPSSSMALAGRVFANSGGSQVSTGSQFSAGSQVSTRNDRSNVASTAVALPGAGAANRAAADQAAQQRLEKYLLRHTEGAVLNNGQGMLSFARVTSYEEQ